MNTSTSYTPAKIRSAFPTSVRFGKIPVLAQTAANNILTKNAASLLFYYMSESDGFAPSAREIYLYTGLLQPHMIRARKELVEHGFIEFDKNANTITILWDDILQMGRVALILAEDPNCNVKESLKSGTFFAERPRKKEKKIRELMNEWMDDDAKAEVTSSPCKRYRKAGGERVEGLTENEFLNWLATGNPFVQREDTPETSTIESYRRANETEIEYLETTPNDIEPYEKHGEFFIQGLTEDEYRAWEAVGIPFVDEEGHPILEGLEQ